MLRLNSLLPKEKDIILRREGGKWGEGGRGRRELAELSRGLPGAPLAPEQSFPSSVKREEGGMGDPSPPSAQLGF